MSCVFSDFFSYQHLILLIFLTSANLMGKNTILYFLASLWNWAFLLYLLANHEYIFNNKLFTVFAHFLKTAFTPFLTSLVRSSKEATCNAGTTGNKGSILGSRRSRGGGHGNPLQNSCLENSTNRGTWRAIDQRVTKSQTWLKRLSACNLFLVTSRNSLYILYLIRFCF